MQFVEIKPGKFTMGSPETQQGRWVDEDQVEVEITKPFEMQTTQVTQQEWEKVMNNNPSRFRGSDLPVESMHWDILQVFLKRLTGQNKDYDYRLPTEAEWEYCCRAGTTTPYFWGDTYLKEEETYDALTDQYAWFEFNSDKQTQHCGIKKANPWGLYDMTGNVNEWVQDIYNTRLLGGKDPLQTVSGSLDQRGAPVHVIRGGSWFGSERLLRSAYRGGGDARGESTIGFRLVRTRKE